MNPMQSNKRNMDNDNQSNVKRQKIEISDDDFLSSVIRKECNDDDRVKDLILNCKNLLNVKDRWGNTPLHWAAYSNNTTAAKLLLDKGCDIDSRNEKGITPLLFAIRRPGKVGLNLKIIKLLLSRGAVKKNELLLHHAASCRNCVIVKLLIKSGIKVDEKDRLGRTALFNAVSRGNAKIVKVLLEEGADPNLVDSMGRTPLFSAENSSEQIGFVGWHREFSGKNRDECIELLSKHAARLILDEKSITPFQHYVRSKNYRAAKSLIEMGLYTKEDENQLVDDIKKYTEKSYLLQAVKFYKSLSKRQLMTEECSYSVDESERNFREDVKSYVARNCLLNVINLKKKDC